jgi:hypothetical protein
MAPTLNPRASSAPESVEALLVRLLPRPSERTVFPGDVVAFNSPLSASGGSSGAADQPNVLVRRVAAVGGEAMVSDDPDEEGFTLPTVCMPLPLACCPLPASRSPARPPAPCRQHRHVRRRVCRCIRSLHASCIPPACAAQGHCWVLADNEDLQPEAAIDSRMFGPLPMGHVIGR